MTTTMGGMETVIQSAGRGRDPQSGEGHDRGRSDFAEVCGQDRCGLAYSAECCGGCISWRKRLLNIA